MLILVVSSIEDLSPHSVNTSMQNSLMGSVLPFIYPSDREKWIGFSPDVCSWKSQNPEILRGYVKQTFRTLCVDGVLRTFSISRLRHFGKIQVEYMPSTVQHLLIAMCYQRFRICTRALPREAIDVSFAINDICGCPEMTALPRGLVHLDVSQNFLCGSITLVNLPLKLKTVYLNSNALIQQEILYIDTALLDVECIRIDKSYIKRVVVSGSQKKTFKWLERV